MGSKYRRPAPDLIRRSLDIEHRLATLENTPRAVNTAVDSGHWKFIADNGVEMVDFGFGSDNPGLGRGWIFRRGETGKPAFYLGGNQASGDQFWRLVDNELNDIITDDAASGQGLARPYLQFACVPWSELTGGTAFRATTASTSFVTAYGIKGYKHHPKITAEYVLNVPVGLTAEVQLCEVSPTGSDRVIDSATHVAGLGFKTLGGVLDSGEYLALLNVVLKFRVASGAGTIGMTMTYAYGKQS